MSDIFFLVLRKLRLPLILLITVYSLATLGMTLIPGVDPQGNVSYMSLFHAFYFVSFMGTTIGFGEIPHAFTDAQRAWVLVCIYISVISWLYAIGTVLSLFQDQTFKNAISNRAFQRSIKRIDTAFYIICGYGETGALVNQGLSELNIQTVIIDRNPDRTSSLELLDLTIAPIILTADTTVPQTLLAAGMNNPNCRGVIAVTHNDHTNLQIALNCKLLNKSIPVICRSEIQDEANNMASFGTDEIVNPFTTFAKRLNLFAMNPSLHQLQNWFINQHGSNHTTGRRPPTGKWIVCGYGRFGKAIEAYLTANGIEVVLVDEDPAAHDAPSNTIIGRGTEANTLLQAGIMQASAVVAASADDANNLSVLMTAEQLNQNIYSVGRVSDGSNEVLFVKARCDYVMRTSRVIANEVLTLISRPLVTNFIQNSYKLSDQEVEQLVTQITTLCETNRSAQPNCDPITWRLQLNKIDAPALFRHLKQGDTLSIAQLSSHTRLPSASSLALLLKRGGEISLIPTADTELQVDDELLFVGHRKRQFLAQRLANNTELVDSLINQNPRHIPLLRWLRRRQPISN